MDEGTAIHASGIELGTLRALKLTHALRLGSLPNEELQNVLQLIGPTSAFDGAQLLLLHGGEVRAFWVETPSGGALSRLITALRQDGRWLNDTVLVESARINLRNAGTAVLTPDGAVHLMVGISDRRGVPALWHIHNRRKVWVAEELSSLPPLYPRLMLRPGGVAPSLVHLGPDPLALGRDANSVWYTPDPTSTSSARLVHQSGANPAFDPAVVTTLELLHLVWTKDHDGNHATRGYLYYAMSPDYGETWTQPSVVAKGTHISNVALVATPEGRLFAVYSDSKSIGVSGRLFIAEQHGEGWTRQPVNWPVNADVVLGARAISSGIIIAFYRASGDDGGYIHVAEGVCADSV